jgi:hypothetical protein
MQFKSMKPIKGHIQNFKVCMAEDNSCKGKIVEAHTISKQHLKNIAIDDHVYTPVCSGYHKNDLNDLYEFKLTGLNKATCNRQFCAHHDNFLFKSFEKDKEFNGSIEQIYDLTFRSLCREYFQKKSASYYFHDLTAYTDSSYYKDHTDHLNDELEDHKFLYNQLKIAKDTELKFLLIETSRLQLATTGILFPLYNIQGNQIQEATQGKRQHGFIYNIVPLKDKAYIIISTVIPANNRVHKDLRQFRIRKLAVQQ